MATRTFASKQFTGASNSKQLIRQTAVFYQRGEIEQLNICNSYEEKDSSRGWKILASPSFYS